VTHLKIHFSSVHSAILKTKKYALVGCLSLLFGCGSGGSDEAEQTKLDNPENNGSMDQEVVKEYLEVTAIDGYIRGATAYLDINGNYLLDNSEPSAITGAGGLAKIEVTQLSDEQRKARFIINVEAGAVDEDTISTTHPDGKPLLEGEEFQLSSLPDQSLATPFTTIVNMLGGANPGPETISRLAASWGIDESKLTSDYIKEQNSLLRSLAKQIINHRLIPNELSSNNNPQANLELELIPALLVDDLKSAEIADVLTSEELLAKKAEIAIATAKSLIFRHLSDGTDITDVEKDTLINELRIVSQLATTFAQDTDMPAESASELLSTVIPVLMERNSIELSDLDSDIEQAANNILSESSIFISAVKSGAKAGDLDNDGISNMDDDDLDGDLVVNSMDLFPFDPTESSDLDNDGIGDNSDNDKDGDGVQNEDDDFPLDADYSEDADGDKVADEIDFYIHDPACSREQDGNGEVCHLTWMKDVDEPLISASESGTIYMYHDDWQNMYVYNSVVNEFVSEIDLTGSPVKFMEFSEQHQRLYLGFESGEIKYLDNSNGLTDFAVQDCINMMMQASEFLVTLNCTGYRGNYVVYDQSGRAVDSSDFYYDTSVANAWNPVLNRIYHFRDGISPNDIYYLELSAGGDIGENVESSYHGDYSYYGPISVSTAGDKVMVGSGDIYDAHHLVWLGALGIDFDFAYWNLNDEIITFKKAESQTVLTRTSDGQVLEYDLVDGELIHLQQAGNKAYLTSKTSSQLLVTQYQPNNDTDGDGVTNLQDKFPLDVSASEDGDGDGFPDSWNEGYKLEDSSTGLTLDVFPLDSACWLESHAVEGVCDYSATVPVFSPELQHITDDDNGNIYVLNIENRKIYQWSATDNNYVNQFSLSVSHQTESELPIRIEYSEFHQRIYIGYNSGKITFIDLIQPDGEVSFGSISRAVNGLAAVGKFLLAQDSSGAWNTHYIFDEDGVLTDSADWNRYSRTYAWNQFNERVYFLRDGTSPNDLIYEEINQVLGKIESSEDSPYHGDHRVAHPIRISPDGSKVILGNGSIYNADSLQIIRQPEGVNYTDVIWNDNAILTLLRSDEASYISVFNGNNYALESTIEIESGAIAMYPNGNDVILLSVTDQGLDFFPFRLTDHDRDGIPGWWEAQFGLDDDNVDDASLDNDGDGLTSLQEFENKTDPNLGDTDFDGLVDGDEVNVHNTNPTVIDTDEDGLSDTEEVNVTLTSPVRWDSDEDGLNDGEEVNQHSSNPLSADSDADGINDYYEVMHELQVNQDDSISDSDEDGLTNLEEFAHNTDPNNSDTDWDGVTDGLEVNTHNTSPTNHDSDNDKMSDGFEITYSLEPLSSSDAALDSDNDGLSNLDEFYLGTDPTDGLSTPVAAAWLGYQGNAAHSGFIPLNINTTSLSTRWSVLISEENERLHPVAATGGKVAVSLDSGYNNKRLYLLDALDGVTDWSHNFGEINSLGAPTVVENSVLVQTGGHEDSFLYSISLDSGITNYRTPYGNQWSRYNAPVVKDDAIYMAGGSYGGIYKFSQTNGEEQWFTDLAQCDHWTPAVDGEFVYVFSNGLKKIHKETGEIVVAVEDEESFSNWRCVTPVLGGLQDLFAVNNGELVAYDLAQNKVKWNKDGNYYLSPVVGLGKVYAVDGGQLKVFDQLTGEQLWTWRPNNSNDVIGNLVLTLNALLLGDGTNTYALDLNTRQQVWSYPVTGHISMSTEGAFYIAQSNGQLTAINNAIDTDQDGMDDWWEQRFGLDANSAEDAAVDNDSDGLTNLEEFELLTNPMLEDTDNDGLSDFAEVNEHQTSPRKFDTDGDMMADGWELEQGFDPLNLSDGALDSDGDEVLNWEEFQENTDPHDSDSLPNMLNSASFSFESGQFPESWQIDDSMESSWAVDSIDASDGEFSTFTSASSAFEFSDYFVGNKLSVDVKPNRYSSSMRFYIDGKLEWILGVSSGDWSTLSFNIPRGRHEIRIESENSIRLDNLIIEPLGNPFEIETNFLTVFQGKLRFYNFENELIREETVQGNGYEARDIAVLPDGRIAIFIGSNSAQLSIYNAQYHQWQHIDIANWSAHNNAYGGIAEHNGHLFLTNTRVTDGIFKVDLIDFSVERFTDKSYIDLNIGMDGLLYALNEYQVDVYDPDSMTLLNDFSVDDNARSVAADSEGNFYVARWDGLISRYDASGQFLSRLDVTEHFENEHNFSSLYDININQRNELYVTNRNGQLLATTTDLAEISLLLNHNSGTFLAFSPSPDEDEDGMPDWWENRYGLDMSDASDASLDLDDDGVPNLSEYTQNTDPTNTDTDSDNVSDGLEINTYQSNPLSQDTDNDGVSDGDEVNIHLTNPASSDSDADGVSDYQEIVELGSNPLSEDTDEDTLPDIWEVTYSLDINTDDTLDDADADGLNNLAEFENNTSPVLSDTDDDGLTDGAEVNTHTTNPTVADSDSDKLPDGWEIEYGFDPLSADGANDEDGDEYTNLQEFYLKSDPTDASDIPQVKPWVTYQGNAAHSGFVPVLMNIANFEQAWSVESELTYHQAVAKNGYVYATNQSYFGRNLIQAYSAATGELMWEEEYESIHSINPPAISGNNVVFQTGGHQDSFIRGLNLITGEETFKTSYGNQWATYQAPTPIDDQIYAVGGYYGGMYGFTSEGIESLNVDIPDNYRGWTPAADDSYVYAYSGPELRVFSRESNQLVYTIPYDDYDWHGWTTNGSGVLGGNDNLLASDNGRLISFDLNTKSINWVKTSQYGEQPSLAYGVIYISDEATFKALDENTGELLWSVEMAEQAAISSDVLVTHNIAFVSTATATYAIDLSSHESVWSIGKAGKLSFSEGMLYIAGDGHLTAITVDGDDDEDGLPNLWERNYGLDVNDATNASGDSDDDGLTDLEEYTANTNPVIADTDGDGLGDGDELNIHLSNPNSTDSDTDGLDDGEEVTLYNTNPNLFDSDNDGYDDFAEIHKYGSDPSDAESVPAEITTLSIDFESDFPIEIDQSESNEWTIVEYPLDDRTSKVIQASGISDNQTTTIEINNIFSAGTLSFDARVDSENCCDTLRVYIDDELLINTGTQDWEKHSLGLTSGEHSIKFEYQKDGSVSHGHDTVWIDNIVFAATED